MSAQDLTKEINEILDNIDKKISGILSHIIELNPEESEHFTLYNILIDNTGKDFIIDFLEAVINEKKDNKYSATLKYNPIYKRFTYYIPVICHKEETKKNYIFKKCYCNFLINNLKYNKIKIEFSENKRDIIMQEDKSTFNNLSKFFLENIFTNLKVTYKEYGKLQIEDDFISQRLFLFLKNQISKQYET